MSLASAGRPSAWRASSTPSSSKLSRIAAIAWVRRVSCWRGAARGEVVRLRVLRIDAAAGEDVGTGREAGGGRAPRHQQLEAGRGVAQQQHGGGCAHRHGLAMGVELLCGADHGGIIGSGRATCLKRQAACISSRDHDLPGRLRRVDVVARTLQEPLGKVLGQPVVIDYKPGAAGNIASEFVARSRPDGYTLVFGTAATHGSNAALYKKLPFDVEADFVPVAPIIDVSNVLTINPDVMNVKTLKEFVELVKANPGKFNYASTGNGTGTHMAFAEFNSRLGLNMTHVPYKGGPEAMTAVLKGETCCIMNQVQTVLTQYKAGKVRLLGVTTAKRVAAIQEVPAIAESGLPGTQGFDSTTWFALFAPKGTDARSSPSSMAPSRPCWRTPRSRASSKAPATRCASSRRSSSSRRCTPTA
jgi:tripartite-type tricarboxylate transporter receptor subunit TctC